MSTGYLQVFTLSATSGLPVPAVSVTIRPENATRIIVTTDENGYSEPVALDAPDKIFSLDENNTTVLPYSTCTVIAEIEGWQVATVANVQIFDSQNALMTIELQPIDENGSPFRAEPQIYPVPEHKLFAGDGGSGPTPISYCNPDGFILREVIIPNKLTIHLGKPSASARNVTVTFKDYIKNVASSEIYPTWPEECLKANIYAQISLTLNRIFTEWYPSKGKGYPFDITNSTSYDQYFVYGRNIFENISKIVDNIFNTYILKDGTIEPFYAEYCDGKTVSCDGMKQWGSKNLAEQGRTAFEILEFYYGNEINLITTSNIGEVQESYPGTALRLGSTGEDVRVIQRQLNRITKNYPFFGTLEVNGTFDAATESTVKKFQKQFSLTADGIVGKSTWYKISSIYVAVKKLAELTSEGEQPTGIPPTGTYPGTALRIGSTGPDVKRIQFYLQTISLFNSSIPFLAVDGIYGSGTQAAVIAFQESEGLNPDGVVGVLTWNEIYAEYASVESDILPPTTTWPGEYPGTVLRVGSRGNDVKMAQFFLTVISEFYSQIPSINPDGIFGSATRTAVISFQNQFGLKADGAIGPATWNKIYEVYSDVVNSVIAPDSNPGIYPGIPLRVGSTGIYVKEVQFYLFLLSAYFPTIPQIAYDGIFGSGTQTAVIEYQKIAGLAVDGVVGEDTWISIYANVLRLRNVDGPIITYTIMPAPPYDVTIGMSGEEVSFIQYVLDLGGQFYPPILPLEITGTFDTVTENSVKSFQDLYSLSPTGIVDSETWAALIIMLIDMLSVVNGEVYSLTGEYPGYVLGPGSAGPAVKELQFYINAIGERYCEVDYLNIDGFFGPETEAAVKDFQEAFGVTVTGIVDQETWDIIYNFYLEATGRATSKIKIWVFDEDINKMFIYYRALSEPMPYSSGTTLLVREFRGSSQSPTIWTTVRAMESWNITRHTYGSGIPVGYAFKRIWEGGHGTTSQHYAGVAFDVGQKSSAAQRLQIWNVANDLGVWGYVEPLAMTPTWVHFDRRYGNPACGGTSGYPTVRSGSKNTYVLILQDALNALGYSTNTLDGNFGPNTENALRAFQRNNSLSADGICGCASWRKLSSAAVGIGKTPTVIN